MNIFNIIHQSSSLSALVIVIMILIAEIVRWKKKMYYNNNLHNPKLEKQYLNKKYHLNKNRVQPDIDKINRDIFLIYLCSLFLSYLIMVYIDLVTGFICHLIISTAASLIYMKKIGEAYKEKEIGFSRYKKRKINKFNNNIKKV